MAGNIGAGMYERKVRRVRFRKGDGVSVKDAAAVGDVGVLLDAGVNEVRGAYTMDEIYRFVEAYIRTMDKGLAWRAMRVRVNSGGDDAGAERMGALVLGDPRVSAAMEKLGKAVAISKARLNVLLGEEIERAAGAGELVGGGEELD